MADGPPATGVPLPDTERLVQQAIESVLHKAPEPPAVPGPDEGKAQPWAETAAPPGKNKRPLEALLEEYAQRVAAAPGARAAAPTDKRPAEAFFERLTRRDGGGGRPRRGRRGRQRTGHTPGQPSTTSGPRQTGPPRQSSGGPRPERPKGPPDRAQPGQREGGGGQSRRRGRRRRR